MTNNQFDWYKTILSKGDSLSLEERAERFHEIAAEEKPMLHDGTEGPPKRVMDYRREAESSYINGNFRSCIFSCAVIVEHVFKHEYLKASENKNLKKIQRGTFKETIELIKKLLEGKKALYMSPFVEKADALRRIRNSVAAHPAYVDLPLSEPWDLVKKINRDDINALIELRVTTDPSIKEAERESAKEEILRRDMVSGLGKYKGPIPWYTLKEVIDTDFGVGPLPGDVRDLIEKSVIKPLALLSYRLMNEIVGGIYGVTKPKKKSP